VQLNERVFFRLQREEDGALRVCDLQKRSKKVFAGNTKADGEAYTREDRKAWAQRKYSTDSVQRYRARLSILNLCNLARFPLDGDGPAPTAEVMGFLAARVLLAETQVIPSEKQIAFVRKIVNEWRNKDTKDDVDKELRAHYKGEGTGRKRPAREEQSSESSAHSESSF